MAIDLKAMSRKDLMKLKEDVAKALKDAEVRERQEALRAAERAAAEYGFSLNELSGGTGKLGASKGPKAAPKYRNPDNPEQTWSGRGRKPQWIHDAMAKGIDVSDLEI
ncbi:H-NS histone family protein [Sedimentitalea sp. JM2-8]|uniref:H-NS histone family protein n=1 Tax=Sedimentitalea xiamensis TaxID=3050037 RepID=A0ABT7FEJ1_9RHOB|nr:H-NS histone family protein [Sedimentitalea xiamensis]MDK3073400.1 H-NS histone family protein [Sedimentitalea xiamensis]